MKGHIDPIWKDEECFIVAGGPSLTDFAWSKLSGKNVIAINKAYQVLPDAEVVFFMDTRFWKWFKEDLRLHKARYKVTVCQDCIPEDGILYLQASGCDGLDLRGNYLKEGKNSGYAAINLAVLLGVRKITLLGYDMKEDKARTHWHDGYVTGHKARKLPHYRKMIDTLAEPLDELGIDVVNAGLNSDLESFMKVDLHELFDN